MEERIEARVIVAMPPGDGWRIFEGTLHPPEKCVDPLPRVAVRTNARGVEFVLETGMQKSRFVLEVLAEVTKKYLNAALTDRTLKEARAETESRLARGMAHNLIRSRVMKGVRTWR